MVKSYSPLALANYFIEKFGGDADIEHMKLQKLVYCAHGWSLGVDNWAVVNERPQVWRYGPVFESLYHVLKLFGRRPIRRPQSISPFEEPALVEDKRTKELLDWVWDRYGHLSGATLSDMMHEAGTPWERVAKENNFLVPHGKEIPDSYIAEEFQDIYNKEFKASGTNSATG